MRLIAGDVSPQMDPGEAISKKNVQPSLAAELSQVCPLSLLYVPAGSGQ